MKQLIAHIAAATALACVLSGCMTAAELRQERINNNPALFTQLDAATQSRISQGLISIGDTPSAVWLALGDPNGRTSDTTAAGTVEVWQYLRDVPEQSTGLVPAPPPPHAPPPPPGLPLPAHYETRTRYVKVVSLQIQFDNGRVSRIQQF